MPGWRIGLGVSVVVALAVVTAFVVGSAMRQEPEVIASEPIARSPAPSPTTTAEPDPMPELHNTGEDFDAIIRSIEEFRDWLFRNPSPDLVDRIYHEQCDCHAELREKLELLAADGVRFAHGDVVIHVVDVLDRHGEAVALRVVDESEPITVVDADGNIVDRSDGWARKAYRYLLVQEASGVWRVRDIISMALDESSSPGLEDV